MKLLTTEKIPSWALAYLINDDPSGLSEEEINMVDEFMRSDFFQNHGYIAIVPKEEKGEEWEEYFSHYPAFGKAGSVVDCEFWGNY